MSRCCDCLRDNTGYGTWGLQPDGFDTVYDNCEQGADLSDLHGMLFVR